jgi:hypothetical protein
METFIHIVAHILAIQIIKLLMEQAAANQLLLYILEIEEELLNERTDHQRAFLLDVEELANQLDPSLVSIACHLHYQLNKLLTLLLQYTRNSDCNDEEESFLSSLKQILSIQISKKNQLLSNIGAFMTLTLLKKKKKAQTICSMKLWTLYKKTYQHQHFWKS